MDSKSCLNLTDYINAKKSVVTIWVFNFELGGSSCVENVNRSDWPPGRFALSKYRHRLVCCQPNANVLSCISSSAARLVVHISSDIMRKQRATVNGRTGIKKKSMFEKSNSLISIFREWIFGNWFFVYLSIICVLYIIYKYIYEYLYTSSFLLNFYDILLNIYQIHWQNQNR